jgi:hypothetical protein
VILTGLRLEGWRRNAPSLAPEVFLAGQFFMAKGQINIPKLPIPKRASNEV